MTRSSRGQTGPLGVVLVFAIVLTGMVVAVSLGAQSIAETKGELGTERAGKTLTQLDSKAAMVALGGTDRQRIHLGSDGLGRYAVHDSSGWLNVSITNTTSGETETVVNETLGAVTYDSGRTAIAYQGGGVWRERAGGSTMLSPPEFHFRNATLTLPIVSLNGTGDATLSGDALVAKRGDPIRRFPNATANGNWTNPLTTGRVNVTVHSEYYRAWGRYFEERTEGVVHYDRDHETATVTLKAPAGPRRVNAAVAATSSAGGFAMSGNGARTDSYTSDDGDGYAGDAHGNGDVTVAGDVTVGGSTAINGDVVTGGSFDIDGGGDADHEVYGDVNYTDAYTPGAGTITGTATKIDGVDGAGPLTTHVADEVDAIAATNDNASASSVISGEHLALSGTETLTAGRYYLKSLEITDGDTLVLDTSGGDITIAVEDYVKLTDDSTVKVQGDGQVKVFVDGQQPDANGYHLELDKDGSSPHTSVPNDNATKFWVYGPDDMQVRIRGDSGDNAVFEGVVYAPGGSSGTSTVTVRHGEVYGGLVASNVNVEQGGAVHFDTALSDDRAIPKGTKIVTITYLHVTVNRIDVDDG